MEKLIVTNDGKSLVISALSKNTNINFTKVCTSDYDYANLELTELEQLSSLSNIKQETDIDSVSIIDSASVKVTATVNNSQLEESYYVRAIGLYAKDDLENEILFGLSIETFEPDYLKAFEGDSINGIVFNITTNVSNTDDININVNPDLTVTTEQLEIVVNKIYNIINEIQIDLDSLKEDVENIKEDLNELSEGINDHKEEIVSSNNGVHGFRYYADELQVKTGTSTWEDIEMSNGKRTATITIGSTDMGYTEKDVDFLIKPMIAGYDFNTILQKAIDRIEHEDFHSSFAYKKIVLLEGQYSLMNFTISKNNISICGLGVGVTELFMNDQDNMFIIDGANCVTLSDMTINTERCTAISIKNSNNGAIRNIEFVSNGEVNQGDGSIAIKMEEDCNYWKFDNIHITNGSIKLNDSDRNIFNNISFSISSLYTLTTTIPLNLESSSSNIFNNIIMKDILNIGIYLLGSGGNHFTNINIEAHSYKTIEAGIYISGSSMNKFTSVFIMFTQNGIKFSKVGLYGTSSCNRNMFNSIEIISSTILSIDESEGGVRTMYVNVYTDKGAVFATLTAYTPLISNALIDGVIY